MSIKERWNDYTEEQVELIRDRAKVSAFWLARLREAFYAGANAGLMEMSNVAIWELNEEINHFNNRPRKP